MYIRLDPAKLEALVQYTLTFTAKFTNGVTKVASKVFSVGNDTLPVPLAHLEGSLITIDNFDSESRYEILIEQNGYRFLLAKDLEGFQYPVEMNSEKVKNQKVIVRVFNQKGQMKQDAFYLDVGVKFSFNNRTVMDFVSASNYKHSAVSQGELDILKDLTKLSQKTQIVDRTNQTLLRDQPDLDYETKEWQKFCLRASESQKAAECFILLGKYILGQKPPMHATFKGDHIVTQRIFKPSPAETIKYLIDSELIHIKLQAHSKMRALTVESEDYDLNSVYDPDNLMDVTFFFDQRKHLIQPAVNKLGSFDPLEDLTFTMDFAFVISKEDYQMLQYQLVIQQANVDEWTNDESMCSVTTAKETNEIVQHLRKYDEVKKVFYNQELSSMPEAADKDGPFIIIYCSCSRLPSAVMLQAKQGDNLEESKLPLYMITCILVFSCAFTLVLYINSRREKKQEGVTRLKEKVISQSREDFYNRMQLVQGLWHGILDVIDKAMVEVIRSVILAKYNAIPSTYQEAITAQKVKSRSNAYQQSLDSDEEQRQQSRSEQLIRGGVVIEPRQADLGCRQNKQVQENQLEQEEAVAAKRISIDINARESEVYTDAKPSRYHPQIKRALDHQLKYGDNSSEPSKGIVSECNTEKEAYQGILQGPYEESKSHHSSKGHVGNQNFKRNGQYQWSRGQQPKHSQFTAFLETILDEQKAKRPRNDFDELDQTPQKKSSVAANKGSLHTVIAQNIPRLFGKQNSIVSETSLDGPTDQKRVNKRPSKSRKHRKAVFTDQRFENCMSRDSSNSHATHQSHASLPNQTQLSLNKDTSMADLEQEDAHDFEALVMLKAIEHDIETLKCRSKCSSFFIVFSKFHNLWQCIILRQILHYDFQIGLNSFRCIVFSQNCWFMHECQVFQSS